MIAKISGFVIFIGLLSYIQIKQILQGDGKKGVAAYCFFMVLGAVIGSLIIAGVEITSPSVMINKVFEPLGKAILGE